MNMPLKWLNVESDEIRFDSVVNAFKPVWGCFDISIGY